MAKNSYDSLDVALQNVLNLDCSLVFGDSIFFWFVVRNMEMSSFTNASSSLCDLSDTRLDLTGRKMLEAMSLNRLTHVRLVGETIENRQIFTN